MESGAMLAYIQMEQNCSELMPLLSHHFCLTNLASQHVTDLTNNDKLGRLFGSSLQFDHCLTEVAVPSALTRRQSVSTCLVLS